MTESADYLLSFTAAGLQRVLCVQMAALRLELGDWSKTRDRGLQDNLLQARTTTTARRIWKELEARLAELPEDALRLLAQGTPSQQNQILWLALCRRYRLVDEFSVSVLREAALFGRSSVLPGDVDAFLHQKAQLSQKIAGLPMTEAVRIRRSLLRLSREAGLLEKGGLVHPQLPDLEVAKTMGPVLLPYWPALLLTDSGLKEVRECR